MDAAGIELATPFFVKDRLTAVLNLGPKSDGRIYNELDIAALWGLVNAAEITLTALMVSSELVRKERLAVMGEVAAIIGHELRNALAAMSHSAFILGSRTDDAASQKHIGIINSQISSSNKTIADILNYVRNREPMLSRCSLAELVADVLETIKTPERILLRVDIPDNFPEILLDQDDMKRAFINLFSNAFDAMPDGGTLTIKAGMIDPMTVEIQISDTGVGIPKEKLDKLFTPLFTTKPNGTGLGLLVVKRAIERHQGTVRVESVEGLGTTFRILLPISAKGTAVR